MLSKVALVDSMDSSLGSKPRASRDLRDMNTIDESRGDDVDDDDDDDDDDDSRHGKFTCEV